MFSLAPFCYSDSPSKTSAITFSLAVLRDSDSLSRTTAVFFECAVVPKCFVSFPFLFYLLLLFSVTCLQNSQRCGYGVVPVGWWCVMEVYVCRALILAQSFPPTTCSSFYILLGQLLINRNLCLFPNSFRHRGSYFKYSGEGSQISWICFGGAVGQGAV